MKKILLVFWAALLLTSGMVAQPTQPNAKKASLGEDGRLYFEDARVDLSTLTTGRDFNSLPGFPFGRPANPTFKNTRGVALADVNNDGIDEILFGADSVLYCLNSDGSILWSVNTPGTIILVPTVGDMDNDGAPEIAINTAGMAAFGTEGGVYLFDGSGELLEGWPQSWAGHWMINAPVMADVDGDGTMEIVTGERVSGSQGFLHVLKMDGTEMEGWPVETPGNVAFTPSVGDINNDGVVDIVSGISSDGSLYAYDAMGTLLSGFPQTPANAKLSYQSPILADLNDDDHLEIIGARHGDEAEYYVVKSDGTYMDGWPVASPGWTYAPPSVADSDGDGVYEIYAGNPQTDGSDDPQPMDVIYGFAPDGSNLANFPIQKVGGNEGVITIADVDNNGVPDLVFTSNLFTIDDHKGFVHAYATDGSGELEGFPLRPMGMTFMNSALLGDIDNDGNLDLTTLSSHGTFGAGVDSVWVDAYDLGYPYIPENIYFNAYKGDNTRSGLIAVSSVGLEEARVEELKLYPNPAKSKVIIELPDGSDGRSIRVIDLQGRTRKTVQPENLSGTYVLKTNGLEKGIYFVIIDGNKTTRIGKIVIE